MKRQSTVSNQPVIPPQYETAFRLTSHLIQKHSDVWKEFMEKIENDVKMVSENRLPLPPAPTKNAAGIFKEFRESYKAPLMVEYEEESGMILPQQTVDDEVGSGILLLFDSYLPSRLQHRHEHLFFQDYMTANLRASGKEWQRNERCSCGDKKRSLNHVPDGFIPSEHFGAIHLLRLVYLLPDLLQNLKVDGEAMELIYSYVYRLVAFILKNKELYFTTPTRDYRLAQESYLERSNKYHEQ